MKLNAVRAMLIASLIIILLYVLGLFLPIIKNTKDSKILDFYKIENKTFVTWNNPKIIVNIDLLQGP